MTIGEQKKYPKREEEEEEEEGIGKLLVGIMEGYKDSVIPALSELNPVSGMDNCGKGSAKRARTETSEAGIILRERVRREKMAENFSLLETMVPSLFSPGKASREKIVAETINYIKILKEETERLEEMKRSISLQKRTGREPAMSGCTTFMKPSIAVTVCNDTAFFGIQLTAKRGLLSKIFEVFHRHNAEVFEVTILVNDHRVLNLTGTFTVGSDGANVFEKIKKEILQL